MDKETDGLFYKQEEILKVLKCPSCRLLYNDARVLPCGDSICLDCFVSLKENDVINNNESIFKCLICSELHKNLNEEQLPINKLVDALFNLKPKVIYRSQLVEKLKSEMKSLKENLETLESNLINGEQHIREHCNWLKNEIDLFNEKEKIENRFDMFAQIDKYNELCKQNYNTNKDNLGELYKSIKMTKAFLTKCVDCLKQYQVNDKEIIDLSNEGVEHAKSIRVGIEKFNSLIFKSDEKFDLSTRNADAFRQQLIRHKQLNNLPKFDKFSVISFDILPDNCKIWSIESLSNSTTLIVASFETRFMAYLIDQDNQLKKKLTLQVTFNPIDSLNCSIRTAQSTQELLITVSLTENNNNYLTRVFIFDLNLTKLATPLKRNFVKQVVALSINESICYMIFLSDSFRLFYNTFDNRLNRIASVRLQHSSFCMTNRFALGLLQMQLNNGKLYIMDKQHILELNPQTCAVERRLKVEGESFCIYENKFILVYDNVERLVCYSLDNGEKIIGLEIRKFDSFQTKRIVSNNKIVCLNHKKFRSALIIE